MGQAASAAARPPRLVVTGGGSGGHIYPALAIVEALRRQHPELAVAYIGTRHGLERDLVPRAGLPFYAIHAQGLAGRGPWRKLRGSAAAARGLLEAVALLRKLAPQAVLATGGYVSGPVGLAASWLSIPLVLQEQNAWPGLANRMLARRAALIMVPYPEVRQHLPAAVPVLVAGNPVRPPASDRPGARARLGLAPEWVVLAATGGSQGAEAINRLMLALARHLDRHPDWAVLWATGDRYFAAVSKVVRGARLDPERVRIANYFYEIADVYAAADLFVGRAGAMTLAECAAYGLPAVFIPSPNVAEDHQSKNARLFADRGAAVVVPESALGGDLANIWRKPCGQTRTTILSSADPVAGGPGGGDHPLWIIHDLMSDARLRQAMGKRAASLADPGSAERMAAAVWDVMGRRAPSGGAKGRRHGGFGVGTTGGGPA